MFTWSLPRVPIAGELSSCSGSTGVALALSQLPSSPSSLLPRNESYADLYQAVGRLTTILELLRSFTTDYIRQTNLLLGEPTADGGQGDLLANFENAAAGLIGHPIGEIAPPVEEKKERKKRTHDPDAPKRPLTPYFLYMQTARSIIATDLGPDAPKGAVQEEGQRRWATMDGQEKLVSRTSHPPRVLCQ